MADKWHEDIWITNNTIENSGSFAIRAYSWRRFHIDNNNLINCAAGINVRTSIVGADTIDVNGNQTNSSQPSESGMISGNIIVGGLNSGRAIEVYGSSDGKPTGIKVIGNEIVSDKSSSVNDAIIINYGEKCTVANNRINGIGGSGIVIANSSTDTVVEGNSIESVAEHGILVGNGCHYINASNNTIKLVGMIGINVTGSIECVTLNGNTIAGVNGLSASYEFIKFSGTINRVVLSANNLRNVGSNYTAIQGLTVSSSSDMFVSIGNNFKGFTVSNAASNQKIYDLT
jgi:hypothetical protein